MGTEMVTFTAEEKGFVIEADGKKLWISYDEFRGNHKSAMEFCKKQGGGDETVENLRFLAEHRDVINEELKKLGKVLISGWYWTNKFTWWSDCCAFIVTMSNGIMSNEYRNNITKARAVSVL